MDAKLLTLNQLAERTGLPAAWLRREAEAGRLPCIRIGRRTMFDLPAVLGELAERRERGMAVPGPTDHPPLTLHPTSVSIEGVIVSFADRETEALFRRERVRRIDPRIQRTALRKLGYLDKAVSLEDLRIPPGNRLEALKGDRAGQHSIRINDQWRIVFRWADGDAHDVSIVDYH
jgi:proteic killer suppression protein